MILITGADGYLGLALMRRYAACGERVIAWVHARGREQLERKSAELGLALGPAFAAVEIVGADLFDPEPFERVSPNVTEIVHAAALTRFDVSQAAAYEVNVAGTIKLAAFARRCRDLKAVSLLSSLYATGLASGPILEEPIRQRPQFANWYEWSKCVAEEVFVERCADLPWRIFRIATAIADDDSGRATRSNAVHATLQVLARGLLAVVPGDPRTLLYFVTRDYAADACIALARSARPRQIFHVCPCRADALPLAELLEHAFTAFGENAEFRRRRVLRPSFCDSQAFDRLRLALREHGSALAPVIGGLAPFARQLYVGKDVRNAALAAVVDPPRVSGELVRRVCRGLVALQSLEVAS
jgi:nucleoside-diphosphate-sugar epimerase